MTAQVTAQVATLCKEPKSAREIMDALEMKHWKTFQTNYLKPLLEAGILERTIPDKPQSRLQKYVTTLVQRHVTDRTFHDQFAKPKSRYDANGFDAPQDRDSANSK